MGRSYTKMVSLHLGVGAECVSGAYSAVPGRAHGSLHFDLPSGVGCDSIICLQQLTPG